MGVLCRRGQSKHRHPLGTVAGRLRRSVLLWPVWWGTKSDFGAVSLGVSWGRGGGEEKRGVVGKEESGGERREERWGGGGMREKRLKG